MPCVPADMRNSLPPCVVRSIESRRALNAWPCRRQQRNGMADELQGCGSLKGGFDVLSGSSVEDTPIRCFLPAVGRFAVAPVHAKHSLIVVQCAS